MQGSLRNGAQGAKLLFARKPINIMPFMRPRMCQRFSCSALSGALAGSHDMFIEEIAVCKSPKRLGAVMKALVAQGQKMLPPTDREGLHPLLIPLTEDTNTSSITCLLRWPQPTMYTNMAMPIVQMKRGAKNVTLVARSADEYLHRMLAEEDQEAGKDGPRPIATAAGPDGEAVFKAGDVEAAGFGGKMQVYIIRKIGMFPDVCEALSQSHIQKGDTTSALVASEWYMRNGYFPGWARPYEFAGELLTSLDRGEEARDMARVALRLPWWSLSGSFEEVARMGKMTGTPEEVRYALSEEAQAAAQAQVSKMPQPKEQKSSAEVALDRANMLMDMVAAGQEPSYESIRAELAKAYNEAGLRDVSNFITSAT